MAYLVELDVSHEPTHEQVVEFAESHGCTVLGRRENGPAGGNPVYTFGSAKYDYLVELVQQLLGSRCDEEFLMTAIVNVGAGISAIHTKY